MFAADVMLMSIPAMCHFTAETIALFLTFRICLPRAVSRTMKSCSRRRLCLSSLDMMKNFFAEGAAHMTHSGYTSPLSPYQATSNMVESLGFFCCIISLHVIYLLPFLDIKVSFFNSEEETNSTGQLIFLKSSTDSALHYDL